MPYQFRLPDETAEPGAEGFVVNWFKDEGQALQAGDLLLEVQFEKVITEVNAPADGVLVQILCPQGEPVKAGQPLCLIRERAEAPPAPQRREAPPAPVESDGAPREIRSTPAARRLARELGVDLARVSGTGPGGRIGEEDVRALGREPLSPAQRLTGERMLASLRETAQFTLGREVDVTVLARLRARAKAGGSPVSLSDLIHRAAVLALAAHPRLQATLEDGHLVLPGAVHLGFAVSRGEDLLVPVIRDAQNRGLAELAAERQRLTEAVLNNRVQAADIAGATFTISNLGAHGIDFFTPVLNPPQSAILGVGRTVERPAFRDGAVVPAQFLTLSLTVDHRVVNGAPGAAFLATLADLLREPEGWAALG